MLTAFIEISGLCRIGNYDDLTGRIIHGQPYCVIEFANGNIPGNDLPVMMKNPFPALKRFNVVGNVAVVKIVDGEICPLDETKKDVYLKLRKWICAMNFINELVDAGENEKNLHADESYVHFKDGKLSGKYDLASGVFKLIRVIRGINHTIEMECSTGIGKKFAEFKSRLQVFVVRSWKGNGGYHERWNAFLRQIIDSGVEFDMSMDPDLMIPSLKFKNFDVNISYNGIIKYPSVTFYANKLIIEQRKKMVEYMDMLSWAYSDGMEIVYDYHNAHGISPGDKIEVYRDAIKINGYLHSVKMIPRACKRYRIDFETGKIDSVR